VKSADGICPFAAMAITMQMFWQFTFQSQGSKLLETGKLGEVVVTLQLRVNTGRQIIAWSLHRIGAYDSIVRQFREQQSASVQGSQDGFPRRSNFRCSGL